MADKKEIVAADDSGTITRHYEDCEDCENCENCENCGKYCSFLFVVFCPF